MEQLVVEGQLEAGAGDVWSVLADFGNVAAWNPNLRASRLLTNQATGVGTQRQCDMKDGKNYVKESVLRWEEARTLEIDIFEGSMPLEQARVLLELEPLSASRTKVVITMSFVPKGGFLGRVAARVMMKPMMRRMLGRLVAGLREKVEAPLAATVASQAV